jgi:CubicO group peptidase (beta-lactamase class C family)
MSVHGEVAAGFEPVRTTFEAHTTEMGKGGAAFAAYLGGRKVVDLRGGYARPGKEWKEDTVSAFYSATKVVPAVVAMLVYDRGQLEFDVPVAQYWPEFAANGKEAITIRHLLAMQAGLPYVPGYEGFLIYDGGGWDQFGEIERRIAEAAPITEIGTPAYAAANFGVLVNAVVRRITGRQLKDIWNEDVAEPLGLDLSLGAPDAVLDRMAKIYNADDSVPLPRGSLLARAFHETEGEPTLLEALAEFGSNPLHLRAGQASADLLGTAESMARVYAMLVNGGSFKDVKIVSPGTVAAFTRVQSMLPDLVHGEMGATGPSSWMLGGIEGNREQIPGKPLLYGPGLRSFGKSGAGGQNGFADPDRGLSVGFLRSHLTVTSPLQQHLLNALYSCLP